MIGRVDHSGRALLNAELKPTPKSNSTTISVWIDTGFTGDLVLPKASINQLQLQESGSVDAILADGSQVELRTYSCLIFWFGNWQTLEIISNDGDFPLLGVGLLLGKELRVNYDSLELSLNTV